MVSSNLFTSFYSNVLAVSSNISRVFHHDERNYLPNDFDIETRIPDCICLSNNKSTALTLSKDNIDVKTIADITNEYEKQNHGLTSDFSNDFFTHKKDKHVFCCTRIQGILNKKNAIYIPGNNDYFHVQTMAQNLKRKGYNFYAISFPNFGFASDAKDTHFSSFNSIPFLFQYIDVILSHYKIKKIDILFGHSTGGLIATMYAEYKNKKNQFIERLVLSSPFFDWYSEPNAKSFMKKEEFLEQVITPLGLIIPLVNVKTAIGTPNLTTCQEFNEINFNPKYKSLINTHTYPEWIRAVTIAHERIQKGTVNVKCTVDIFHSDKSVYWTYADDADNTLDVDDIKKYGKLISSDVRLHEIPNSIHSTFMRICIGYFGNNKTPSVNNKCLTANPFAY